MDRMIRMRMVAFAIAAVMLFPLSLKADGSFVSARAPVANDVLALELTVSPLSVEPISHDAMATVDRGLTIAPTYPVTLRTHDSESRLSLPSELLQRVRGATRSDGAVLSRDCPLSRVRSGLRRVFSFCGPGGCG